MRLEKHPLALPVYKGMAESYVRCPIIASAQHRIRNYRINGNPVATVRFVLIVRHLG